MDFCILGPLEAWQGDAPIKLGGPRQQTVMAMLLLGAGKVIPVDRLIDAVWGDEPPLTARDQIQICISNLRRVLTPVDGLCLIETRSPGYLLQPGDCTLDARTFDARVSEGRNALSGGNLTFAIARFRSALSLWRGTALSNISSELVQHSVMYLNERQLGVLEECIEIELSAGRSPNTVGELMLLSEENPLRERFRILLMTALYRTGRQPEALEVYRNTCSVLTNELGIEPSSSLMQLHKTMLAGEPIAESAGQPRRPADPGLARASAAAPTPATPTARAQRPQHSIPMLLPAAIPDFTGRSRLIGQILAKTEESGAWPAMPITVLYGQGGVGKTSLAVHLAHRQAAEFPDGQLFAHLRPGSQPADPADVLRRFLRALGVSGSSLPQSREDRVDLYRDLLSKRRLLIVLDDAVSEDQIAPLLPGSAQCSVLITSRRRLTGLPVTSRKEIRTLGRRSAVTMVGRIVGAERIKAEPEAVERLCELCRCLPLALRIVASRLAARPHWSVAALVDRLVDERHRLDELSHSGMGLRASISLSHDALSPQARRLFRLLALTEAPNFTARSGLPLIQIDPLDAEDLLEELTEAYLLDIDSAPTLKPVCYRFHDMMRPFAQERLMELESPQERRAALDRLAAALTVIRQVA